MIHNKLGTRNIRPVLLIILGILLIIIIGELCYLFLVIKKDDAESRISKADTTAAVQDTIIETSSTNLLTQDSVETEMPIVETELSSLTDAVINLKDIDLVYGSWNGRAGTSHTEAIENRCSSSSLIRLDLQNASYQIFFHDLDKLADLDGFEFGYLLFDEESAESRTIFDHGWNTLGNYIEGSKISAFTTGDKQEYYLALNFKKTDSERITYEDIDTLEYIIHNNMILKYEDE